MTDFKKGDLISLPLYWKRYKNDRSYEKDFAIIMLGYDEYSFIIFSLKSLKIRYRNKSDLNLLKGSDK